MPKEQKNMTVSNMDLNEILDAEARAYAHYIRLQERATSITKELKGDVIRGGSGSELLEAMCDARAKWKKLDDMIDFTALEGLERSLIDLWYRKGFRYRYGWKVLKQSLDKYYGTNSLKHYQYVERMARNKLRIL